MCVVSMIGDHYQEKWRQLPITLQPQFWPAGGTAIPFQMHQGVSRAEFDALKVQVEEMVALLKRAKLYDEEHDEPACGVEEKMDLLRKVARLVGVDLDARLAGGVTP